MKQSDYLVSVIIPNYCHSQYLDERISSVLNQTYKNFEVIILDDCSPDNGASKRVIEKYRSSKHVSHIIYNKKNSGNTFEQWQLGVNLSKGEVIWIAESDDFCERDMLEKLMFQYCRYDDTSIVYTSYKLADENGIVRSPSKFHALCSHIRKHIIPIRHYSGKIFNTKCQTTGNCIENASTAIFRKSAYLNINKDFNQYKGAGDYLFWVYLAEEGSVTKLNKGLSYFRRHSGTVTTNRDADGSNFIANKKILEYIKEKYKITDFRWKVSCLEQIRRISKVQFNNEEIRNRLFAMWPEKDSISLVHRLFYRISMKLIKYLDFYI